MKIYWLRIHDDDNDDHNDNGDAAYAADDR